jgi:broad specificity phosphatase PhoE
MSVKITYFVHGTTTDNENHIATGWDPGELSELGIQQSKELRQQANHLYFDAVFCSDLKRAVDSAKLAFGGLYEIIQDRRLRECNYGDWNQKEKAWDISDFVDEPYPNGESYRDVEGRIADFLDFLKNNYDCKHVAVVAHQAPQLALGVLIKKKTWEQAIAEDWRHTGAWQPGWDYVLE